MEKISPYLRRDRILGSHMLLRQNSNFEDLYWDEILLFTDKKVYKYSNIFHGGFRFA